MKRFLAISIFLTVLTTGCMNYDQAGTVDPADVTSNTAGTPPGAVTSLTATVGNISEDNPYIIITFSSPINTASINYDVNVVVQYPDGVTTLTEGSGINTYAGITNTSNIILDLTDSAPTSGTTVRVSLTGGINAYADNTVTLTPLSVTRTLP